MMKRKPAGRKSAAKKPAGKKPAGKGKRKMPPELLERFKGKSGAKKDENTAGMRKKGMPAGKKAAKAEAAGEKSGAGKRKGTARGTGMMSPRRGTSNKK
jgi:hypothetical protein